MDTTLSANQWNQRLDFPRPKPRGGQFKDGECSKLLRKIHLLEDFLKSLKLEIDELIE